MECNLYDTVNSCNNIDDAWDTHWSLDLLIRVQFQLHEEYTVLQPFRRIELIAHIAMFVLSGRPTHLQLSQMKHVIQDPTQGN